VHDLKTKTSETLEISGIDQQGRRISSKALEEKIQEAVAVSNHLRLETYGQHNIGGRIFKPAGPVHIRLKGPAGQRLGCMGQPGTTIVCEGPASDDVGYLNIGADIVVLGDATNGVCNAMAQGRVMIRGSIGSRGLTMTKWNPEYARPQLWVLGSVGDFFGEFNCGGIGVICGVEAKSPQNVLGYRPCVGMVGGWVYYRGRTDDSYSRKDVRQSDPDDEQWAWLRKMLPDYLETIERMDLLDTLSVRDEWKILLPVTPQERTIRQKKPMSMAEFRRKIWIPAFSGPDAPSGGDPLRDLAPGLERSPIGFIESGDLRRRGPFWANREMASPCTYYCPVHIPTVDRLRLIREGQMTAAYELVMRYMPLPASICGTVCPNLCMDHCSRQRVDQGISAALLGQALLEVPAPSTEPAIGRKVAIVGGGPAGMSAAWQLAQAGIEAHLYEQDGQLGGKLSQAVPRERLPQAVWDVEMERFLSLPLIKVYRNIAIDQEKVIRFKQDYDYVIIAVGTHEPRRLQFRGNDRVLAGLDFLKASKGADPPPVGRQVVIIGAGNVGCDIACEAYRLGAEEVTLVDIQKPLAFGKEKAAAEALGAKFAWPVVTREVTDDGLIDSAGNLYPAQTVIVSVGDIPAVDFLPGSVERLYAAGASWVKTDAMGVTSDPRILAVGDVGKPGLATDAVGSGKKAASYIIQSLTGRSWLPFDQEVIPLERLTLEHHFPSNRRTETTQEAEAERCLSCGSCRDCQLCEFICPQQAISRSELADAGFQYQVDDARCIACGFCADTCPCGIWVMRPW
jgi:NADPH-dependent glutamate synthase beta subunit-like oxidoreductase/glutamate synthase domain-containing protein 3/ferredoxin